MNVPDPPSDLLAFLHERDVHCPLCNYNLRNLQSDRCPECGRELQLTIGLTEPYLRAWIALAVSICASAGVGLLILCIIAKEGWPSLKDPIFDLSLVYFLACIPMAVIVICIRRKFLRVSREMQTGLAVAAGAATLLGFFMFFSGLH